MWVRERVVICKIDDGIRRSSIESVIAKYLLYNVQHVSALIIGHNEACVRISSKITIAHNTMLQNSMISLDYSMYECFVDYGENKEI
jgi:hypothetical protein